VRQELRLRGTQINTDLGHDFNDFGMNVVGRLGSSRDRQASALLRSAYRLNRAAAIWERPALWTTAEKIGLEVIAGFMGRRILSAVSGNEGMSHRIRTVVRSRRTSVPL
jgi:hypothetical protein